MKKQGRMKPGKRGRSPVSTRRGPDAIHPGNKRTPGPTRRGPDAIHPGNYQKPTGGSFIEGTFNGRPVTMPTIRPGSRPGGTPRPGPGPGLQPAPGRPGGTQRPPGGFTPPGPKPAQRPGGTPRPAPMPATKPAPSFGQLQGNGAGPPRMTADPASTLAAAGSAATGRLRRPGYASPKR